MTKVELITSISEDTGVCYKDAKKVLDCFVTSTLNALKNSDSVSLTGFGKFRLQEYPSRIGRNPMSGEKVIQPGFKVVKFKPSTRLKAFFK